jgi:hypothetical protein
MDFRTEIAKWGYNKGNSIDVEILVNEILPTLFSQQEKMYSEEEVEHLIHLAVFQSHCGVKDRVKIPNSNECAGFVNKWFEQHKKK